MEASKMAHAPTPPNYNSSRQIGVAAIEFALIVTLLCLMLVGCLIYWRVLQAQQSVTRSAGDGARLVQSLIYGTLPGYDITKQAEAESIKAAASEVVKKSLQGSGLPGNPQQDSNVTFTSSANQMRLHVTYRLPPLFGNADGQAQPVQLGSWALVEPASLQATAVVSFDLNAGK